MGVGCYAYWYRDNPSYVETSPDPTLQYPAPKRFDGKRKEINSALPGLQTQADGQINKQLRRPTKGPEEDVCSEEELKCWERFGRA